MPVVTATAYHIAAVLGMGRRVSGLYVLTCALAVGMLAAAVMWIGYLWRVLDPDDHGTGNGGGDGGGGDGLVGGLGPGDEEAYIHWLQNVKHSRFDDDDDGGGGEGGGASGSGGGFSDPLLGSGVARSRKQKQKQGGLAQLREWQAIRAARRLGHGLAKEPLFQARAALRVAARGTWATEVKAKSQSDKADYHRALRFVACEFFAHRLVLGAAVGFFGTSHPLAQVVASWLVTVAAVLTSLTVCSPMDHGRMARVVASRGTMQQKQQQDGKAAAAAAGGTVTGSKRISAAFDVGDEVAVRAREVGVYAVGQSVAGLEDGQVTGVVVSIRTENGTAPPHHFGAGGIYVRLSQKPSRLAGGAGGAAGAGAVLVLAWHERLHLDLAWAMLAHAVRHADACALLQNSHLLARLSSSLAFLFTALNHITGACAADPRGARCAVVCFTSWQ